MPGDPDNPSLVTRRADRAAVLVRAVFAALAVMSLGLAIALYVSAEHLGLDESSARLIASALLVAGALDAAVVAFWDRIFGRGA
jgi:hypothetical protein